MVWIPETLVLLLKRPFLILVFYHQKWLKASEQLGEVASQAYIKQNFPNATKLEASLPGNGKQGEFDQIYIDNDTGRLIIVEAKGGNATWGARIDLKGQRAEQGSKSYMDKVIQN